MLTKVKFRDQLKEYVRKNFGGELGQLLPIRQSKLMTRFYLMEIHNSESDEEITDELVGVRLKNFEDLRKLATDAGMKDEYVLHYQPDSTIVHGHWPALRRYYLKTCREPLHRLHLQPTFSLPPLDPQLLDRAFRLFMAAYELWVKRYGLQDRVTPLVDQYFENCNAVTTNEDTSQVRDPG
jgi:hypothetical protein